MKNVFKKVGVWATVIMLFSVFAVFAGCRGCVVPDTQLGQVESVRVQRFPETSIGSSSERFRIFFPQVENATSYKMEFAIIGEDDFVVFKQELKPIEPQEFITGVLFYEIWSYATIIGRQPGNTVSVTVVAVDDTGKFTQTVSEFDNLEIENEGTRLHDTVIYHLSVDGYLTFIWAMFASTYTISFYRNDEILSSQGFISGYAGAQIVTSNMVWFHLIPPTLVSGETITVRMFARPLNYIYFPKETVRDIVVNADPFDIDNL